MRDVRVALAIAGHLLVYEVCSMTGREQRLPLLFICLKLKIRSFVNGTSLCRTLPRACDFGGFTFGLLDMVDI